MGKTRDLFKKIRDTKEIEDNKPMQYRMFTQWRKKIMLILINF